MSSQLALADLPQIERRTLSETAYDALSDLLASGRLAPGDRLSLRQTAAALGVSVMPIREAVSRLVADGALEVAPNRAVRVPILDAGEFRALAETRMVIEGLAAGRAAERRDAAELAAIRRAEEAFRANAQAPAPDGAKAVALNRDMHFAVYAACGLAPMREIIARLWLKAGPVLNLDLRAHPERLQHGSALRRHAEVLRAVEARDATAAAAAVAGDIHDAADFILSRGGLRGAESS